MNLPDTIELLPTAGLVPYARNARTHSPGQVAQIAASIREFGWTVPVLVDGQNGIIAGHGRVMAAQALGMTEVPCVRLAHLTDRQRRAYILADNKLALNAGWDDDLLQLQLEELQAEDYDLGLTGFDLGEIEALLSDADVEQLPDCADDEATPESPERPVTVLGDVWLLGKHRLMCGDSRNIQSIQALAGGALTCG